MGALDAGGRLNGGPPALRVSHVVSPQPVGETGGVDRHVGDLVLAQQAGGLVVPTVIELGDKGFAATLRERGVTATTVHRPYHPSVPAEAARRLAESRPDVVHTHGYDADLIGVCGCRRLRPRPALVATVHGLSWRPVVDLTKTVASLVAVGTFADAVLVTSTARARWLRRVLPTAVCYVPNGVDRPTTEPERDRVDRSRPTVVFIGRLAPEKRVDLVLAAIARVARVEPEVRCRVVGSGGEDSRLRRECVRRGLEDHVEFCGLRTDVPAILDEADVLLLLSDTEGTPRAR